jgi:hypothetical protein
MKKIVLFALCAALLCLSGCVIPGFYYGGGGISVSGRGELERYEIPVGEYSRVRIEGFCSVNYYSASSDTVTLEIQENLREYYIVEVVGRELVVRYTRRVNFSNFKTPVLTVSVPVLERLDLAGAGTFTAYDPITADSFTLNLAGAGSGTAELNVDRLIVDVAGAGSFELTGTADTADVGIAGAGELKALSLQTRIANIDMAGAGTVKIACSEKLTVDAAGMGTVEYRGSPSLDINRSGLVSVRQVD